MDRIFFAFYAFFFEVIRWVYLAFSPEETYKCGLCLFGFRDALAYFLDNNCFLFSLLDPDRQETNFWHLVYVYGLFLSCFINIMHQRVKHFQCPRLGVTGTTLVSPCGLWNFPTEHLQ